MSSRSYSSPVREQQKAETRDRILDALVEVVLQEGVHAFSVQNVAARAGVSHRTVYRHFDTREALLDGLGDRLVAEMADRVPLDAVLTPETVQRSFLAFEDAADAVRAGVLVSLALELETAGRSARTERLRAAFVSRFPSLDPEEVGLTFTVVRELLASSRSWFLLRRAGLDVDRGAAEVARILTLVLRDLERRDAEAGAAAAKEA